MSDRSYPFDRFVAVVLSSWPGVFGRETIVDVDNQDAVIDAHIAALDIVEIESPQAKAPTFRV